MRIAKDTAVWLHYTLRNDAGEIIDESEKDEPLGYIHGQGDIVPGLENALAGKAKGDKLNVKVEPAEGYGERSNERMQTVPRDAFEDDAEIVPGMQFQTEGPEGLAIVTVVQVIGDEVTIDANHPLAGQNLHFDVEVIDVRTATREELEHGHIHGPGGHHH